MSRISHSQDRDGDTKYSRYAKSLRLPKEAAPVAQTRSLLERVWKAMMEAPLVSEIGTSAKFISVKCCIHEKKLGVILLLLERAGRITVEGDLVRLAK